MKSFYRRLIWGIFFIVLLILVAILSAYFGRNFTGIGLVPTRSAFAGRLPSVANDPNRFQFFYATNRANETETFNGQGSQLGKEILTGTFDVQISPYLPIKPWIWFKPKKMKLVDRQALASDNFHRQLRQAVQASPQKSLLVIVWGYRDWFQSAALKTAYTAYALDINTPALLFDWPGNQGGGPSGYSASRQMSYQSAPDLGRTLAQVIRRSGAEKVWLMGSSLGCQTICDSLAWLVTQPDLFKGKTKIDHVILSAPDVSAQMFDEKFSQRIKEVSRNLTTYVTSNDRALIMSRWINRSHRLGRITEISVPPEDRKGEYEFEEALELMELQKKGAKNISIVDATPINRTRNLHHFFTDSPEFFDDLYQRLLQPNDIVSRRLHKVDISQNRSYWILWSY